MKLATSNTPEGLAIAVTNNRHRARCFVIIYNYGDYLLYGSDTNSYDALIEAKTDHPLCSLVRELEYLPNSFIATMGVGMEAPPMT